MRLHITMTHHHNDVGDTAFYSVLRRRVTSHLKSVGCPDGGPTLFCLVLFWFTFAVFVVSFAALLAYGSVWMALLTGVSASQVGAFG